VNPSLPRMPGAVGAIVAARRNRRGGGSAPAFKPTPRSATEQARQDAAMKEYEHRVRINKIIGKFDKNKSGKLEKDQLILLLTDIDGSTPTGTQPSEEEVTWILKCADKAGDGAISPDEVEDAISCWLTFCQMRAQIDEKLEKYDVSKTGNLSKEEIRNYLVDLNGGMPVTDAELDMVFQDADVAGDGVINKYELSRATALWYTYVEEQKKKSCCTVL